MSMHIILDETHLSPPPCQQAQDMNEENECIQKNQIWDLVEVPKYKDVISVKWIYKTKQDVDGNV